jgi:DNA-binding NarL/FixJ family response regulator
MATLPAHFHVESTQACVLLVSPVWVTTRTVATGRLAQEVRVAEDQKRAVLLVEDDRRFRDSFARTFTESADFQVATAVDTVAAALQALRDTRADLLLADLGLPDGSGLDVIRAATASQPECAILVVTVFGDEEHVVNAIEAGASGYLLKDSSATELLAAARDLLAGGSPISPMVARLVLNRMRGLPEASAPGDAEIELTERETQILSYVAKGFSFADICGLLGITANTVKTHINRIYRKLAVHSRGQAVYEATRLGLIDL